MIAEKNFAVFAVAEFSVLSLTTHAYVTETFQRVHVSRIVELQSIFEVDSLPAVHVHVLV